MRTVTKSVLAGCLCALLLAAFSAPAQAAFGFKELDVTFSNEDTTPATLAGSHPFLQETTVGFNTEPSPVYSFEVPAADLKNLNVVLPPGLVADTTAIPRCPQADFVEEKCGPETQVGINEIQIGDPPSELGNLQVVSVNNLVPTPGTVAKLGFVVIQVPITLEVSLSDEFPYNGLVTIKDSPEAVPIYRSLVKIWGVPADPAHDPERSGCGGGCDLGPEVPFLTMPTSCQAPVPTTFSATSWQEPLATPVTGVSASDLTVTGCDELEFEPAIENQPTNTAADSPTGLDFDLEFDHEGLLDPDGRAQSAIEKAVVTLPEGVITNPATASGLGACSLAQYESETINSVPGTGCPENSKVGSVEIESPLIEPVVHGSIYVAKQKDNPFGNLLTIYMVAKNPELGIMVRQAGRVEPDPATGQLTTTFEELPQLPFSRFHLHFRSGPRAPLITPQICGTYAVDALLYPYAEPGAPLHETASFQVTSGANGAPCATSEAALPHTPGFTAGTLSPVAGSYSPFVFKLERQDGSQRLAAVTATLPKGLVGKLAGIPYCSETALSVAASRSGEGLGALEAASPSCPAASEVGKVTVGAGAGSQPYYVQGRAYLAGPYKGAPLSVAIVTPAIAGPFDLGVVLVRTALYVDVNTAQITAISDPVPTILHGLPLDVRSISLDMSRPNFTLNPTSCEPAAVTATAVSTLGTVTPLNQYFQASACGDLAFKPKLSLSMKGGTKRDQHPALTTVLKARPGDANLGTAMVLLPHSAFIDPDHISNPCTRAQYSAGQCPPFSVLGQATAYSPLLDEPLKGPIYFRSNGGERELPDVVLDLHGQIHITQIGIVDSRRERIRTRFLTVPDAPLTKVVIRLKGGKRQGLLVNSANLCKHKQRATVTLSGQNGRRQTTTPVIATSCKKSPHRK